MCEREFHTLFRAVLCHTDELCWSLRERRGRNGTWPRNTQHPICQRRVYILDLETSWYIDCALESAVLYIFHRIHHKAGVCISKKGRGPTVARDRESTIMRQVNAYILFLETWELKCGGDEAGLRLIAYFHARTHDLSTLSCGYSSPMCKD